MSRSALYNQTNTNKQRTAAAQVLIQTSVADGLARTLKGDIKTVGNPNTYNLNQMLHNNLTESQYFLKLCSKVPDIKTLIDEIYYKIDSVEPWSAGSKTTPSSAFCCLMRLFLMRCSDKQMHSMLNHVDSPYIRCIGFLYLRYATEPDKLWGWFKPYVYDTEEFSPTANKKLTITIGDYVRSLVNDIDYYGTILPRLPVMLQREMKVKMLQEKESFDRSRVNLTICEKEFFVGAKVRGLYEDEENPLTWYEAVIDSVEHAKEEWEEPKYWVTFTEYGNSELLTLGEMEPEYMNSGAEEGAKDKYEEVMRAEKEGAAASGKNYSKPLMGVKNSLAMSVDMTSRIGTGAIEDRGGGGSDRGQIKEGVELETRKLEEFTKNSNNEKKRQRTDEDLLAIKEKKNKLIKKYA